MKEQMESGKYKPSCTSYRSTFFAVEKKGGALWIVHDLQPLNAVTIHDATLPPRVDDMIESFSGQVIYGLCHTLPQFNPTEPRHVCTHLMMDCDLTQSRHHHAGQHGTVSDPAISNISGHLQTGRDSVLTAHCRRGNNLQHESLWENRFRARMMHTYHPQSRLHSIT